MLLEEHDGEISIGDRNITNLRFADDIAALAEEGFSWKSRQNLQGATCVRRQTPQLSGKHTMYRAEKSERPVLGEAYDVRRPQDFGPRC